MARLFLLALILVPALAQGVRTGITPGEMEALLKAGSYRYERVEGGGRLYFHLPLAGLRAVLFLQDCREGSCESLLLYAGFSTDNPPSLERVNEWNREKRFSRAYLDEEGDPVLEADLDLAGGVADGAIRAFLDLFEENLRAFAAWIGWE
mgnify:FL=1